jgi:hypothetical protein
MNQGSPLPEIEQYIEGPIPYDTVAVGCTTAVIPFFLYDLRPYGMEPPLHSLLEQRLKIHK